MNFKEALSGKEKINKYGAAFSRIKEVKQETSSKEKDQAQRILNKLKTKSESDEIKMHKVVSKAYSSFRNNLNKIKSDISGATLKQKVVFLVKDAKTELDSTNRKNWENDIYDI